MSPAKPRKLTPRQEAASDDTAPERLKELAQDPKLARLVAANPGAPTELLLELSHSDDKAVRKACTSNANTPVEALLKLGAQFPEQLLENPVFDLLLLAHPGLFEELPTSTLNSLLKRDQVPVELIRWAWKYRGESTLHSLLMNPNTPVDVVEELCKSNDPEVRMAAELHCSQKLRESTERITSESDLHQLKSLKRYLIVGSEPEPKYWLFWEFTAKEVIQLDDQEIGNRMIPIMADYLRKEVASDHKTPVEYLVLLAKDKNPEVRGRAAENSNTPADALMRLAKDKNPEVRGRAAENSNTPADALMRLAKDEDSFIRKKVARNSQAPPQVLALLARDIDERVRENVAENIHAPAQVLTLLAADKSGVVRVRAKKNAQIRPDDRPTAPPAANRFGVTWQSSAEDDSSKEKLRKAISERCVYICSGSKPSPGRRFLFTLPQCPANLLAKNFRSRSWLERFAIAGNPSTPEAVLARMANEGNQLVRRAAKANLEARAHGSQATSSAQVKSITP